MMQNAYPRNPKATLWLCAYQGVTLSTFQYVEAESARWPNLTRRVKGGDANIDRARSRVASAFLQESEETAGSVLLMLDHDNAARPGDLAYIAKRALEHNAVVGGIYPKRVFGAGPALRLADDATGEYELGTDEGLLPAEFVGTGFIAIPRTILAVVAETLPLVKGDFWPFFMPYIVYDANGVPEYPTDDWAFCARVRAAGFPVYASTYPRVTHEGSHIFRMVDSDIQPPADLPMTIRLGQREAAYA